jgi:hypothetical protein
VPEVELRAWVPVGSHDVYAVSSQECAFPLPVYPHFSTAGDAWTAQLCRPLPRDRHRPSSPYFRCQLFGSNYTLLRVQSLWNIRLNVFIRTSLLTLVSGLRSVARATGTQSMCRCVLTNSQRRTDPLRRCEPPGQQRYLRRAFMTVLTRDTHSGACIVSFFVQHTHLCFLSAHLAAHADETKARHANAKDILLFSSIGERRAGVKYIFHFSRAFLSRDFCDCVRAFACFLISVLKTVVLRQGL